MNDDDALARQAAALLAGYRAEEALPDDVRKRVWRRIAQPRQRASAPTRKPVAIVFVAALAAAVVIVWAGAWVSERAADRGSASEAPHVTPPPASERATTPIAEPESRPEPTAPSGSPEPLPASPVPAVSTPTPSVPAQSDRQGASPRREPSEPVREADTVEEELALLTRARAALDRDDPSLALALLDEAHERFPKAALAQERLALRVLASCAAGQAATARAHATEFVERFPSSPLRARVEAACR